MWLGPLKDYFQHIVASSISPLFSSSETMSYYDYQGNDEEGVDEYDDYDPTPYDGGFNIALIYGRPLPASEEICYPISSSSSSDDYERPQYEADSEPSAYGDEALMTEYSSYSRPKPYGGGSEYGRPSYGEEQPESEYGRPSYEEPVAVEEYRNTSYEQPEEEEGYRKPARYEQPEDEEDGYGRTSYGNQEEEEYQKPSYEDEYGERTYGRQKSDDEDNEDEEKRERRHRW